MGIKPILLDSRTSEDIYKQALELAKAYCSEWAAKWPADSNYFNPEDHGMVILKLFSGLTGSLITQLNKIPDKHFLAFLDFVGIDLLPARPAIVPLTFYLSEKASGIYIPARTAVASSERPELVFETLLDLSAIDSRLSAVYSFNPWGDVYTEHTNAASSGKNDFYIFGAEDGQEKGVDHALFLGDDNIFDIRRETQLTISLTGTNLSKDYFAQWYAAKDYFAQQHGEKDNPLAVDLSEFPKIKLTIKKLDRYDLNGTKSYWIAVKPEPGTKITKKDSLPEIQSISIVDLAVGNIIPEAALANNTPVDVKKGFYPFGEIPKKGDAFYIGCDEAFSKAGADITITVELRETLGNVTPQLRWEYWNGSKWENIAISDGTSNFTSNKGDITFNCTSSIQQTEINGQMNRWIRARIESDKSYGSAAAVQMQKVDDIITALGLPEDIGDRLVKAMKNYNIQLDPSQKAAIIKTLGLDDNLKNQIINKMKDRFTFGFEQVEPTLKPPFITSLTIGYSFTNGENTLFTTYNNFNFQYKTVTETDRPFDPYEPSADAPALYLGFDRNIAGRPGALYFATKEKIFGEEVKTVSDPDYQAMKPEDEAKDFVWKYFNGKDWKEFEVQDETDSFTTDGIVNFLSPADVVSSENFSKNLCWIKVEPKTGKWFFCPRLHGIFSNTVWAVNSVTTEDEILGSGNGEPSLSLSFSKKPVLKGQIIEVREPSMPPKDELDIIGKEEGADAVRVIREESGEIKEVWVRWHEVSDFALSLPINRHYVVDRANGKAIFGDGTKGMLPPKGENNIVAKQYKSGGGKMGNIKPESITMLKKAIPSIEKVTNHVSPFGGVEQESQDSVFNRGPHAVKNRNRAVTKEDFEWLAREASQDVIKAKCVPTEDGIISVIVVPATDDNTPLPGAGLLDTVKQYLTERTLLTIHHKIAVVGPDYKKIDVNVTVKPTSPGESIIVEERVKERLKVLFHPLKGGQNYEGWEFGQNIFISEVAAVLEDIKDVDYVIDIELIKTGAGIDVAPGIENKNWISIEDNALPCIGSICIEVRKDKNAD